MTLTEAQNGQNITLAPGDVIEVRLPENPTTGYRWQIVRQPPQEVLVLASDNFEPPSGQIGAGGVRVFQFRARSPGKAELALGLSRAWEGPSSALDHYRINVDIGGSAAG